MIVLIAESDRTEAKLRNRKEKFYVITFEMSGRSEVETGLIFDPMQMLLARDIICMYTLHRTQFYLA